MEDLQELIKEDLDQVSAQDKQKSFDSFSKMSKVNLAKQEKKILIEYAESKGLLKGLTDRQKERLNRKELAELIKGGNSKPKSEQKAQTQENVSNPLEEYQDAIITALNGDYSRLDSLAFKNVNSFIIDGANNMEEIDEKTLKKIKLAKFGLSAGYLAFKFTGGVTKWKARAQSIIQKIKDKRKKKTNV